MIGATGLHQQSAWCWVDPTKGIRCLCLLWGIVAVRDFDVRGSVADITKQAESGGGRPLRLDLSAISSRHKETD